MDSITFWMISGTSKMFSKSGPAHPVFWADRPRLYNAYRPRLYTVSGPVAAPPPRWGPKQQAWSHRKIIRKSKENHAKNIGIIMVIVWSFMGEMCLKNAFRRFLELICFRLVQ